MIVTLLTDFGTNDYFVAAMKGVILSHDSRVRIVDITHHVPPHDISAAAFQILAAYPSFPPGTVHTVVVDPGVGSQRRPMALAAAGQLFVGPDNGVFDLVMEESGPHEIRHITNPALRIEPVSRTFHGRDVFAPAAAALASGFDFDRLGERITDPVHLDRPTLPMVGPGEIVGSILHIDGFGNCITSLRETDLPGGATAYTFRLGDTTITEVRETYSGADTATPFFIPGSAGFLEISVDRGSAASTLGVMRGEVVRAVRGR